MKRFGVRDKVTTIVGDATKMSVSQADFAFIDVDGSYRVTKGCLNAVQRCSVIAVHDYGRSGCYGATRVINEYRRKGYSLRTVDTLAILEK